MNKLVKELLDIEGELQTFIDKTKQPEIEEPLKKLIEVCKEAKKAWSGSWSDGYVVYYAGLEPPPPDAHWNKEYGFKTITGLGYNEMRAIDPIKGDWRKYDPDEIRRIIYEKAGKPDLSIVRETDIEGRNLFKEKSKDIISIFTLVLKKEPDPIIKNLRQEAAEQQLLNVSDFINLSSPSRHTIVKGETRTPPHLTVMEEALSLQCSIAECRSLLDITDQAVRHLKRSEKESKSSNMTGTKVFIGHGHSPDWRQLGIYLTTLDLNWDEFDSVAAAGKTTIGRISEMLDAAAIAFIVMTGEDKQADKKTRHARMNVVHEVGLFQGRLGFDKAIILLEKGCQKFSNIDGLVHIQFNKGMIGVTFEKVRRVLEREGLIEKAKPLV